MRLTCLLFALGLIVAAPAAAQDPGVVVVGHGPDVPNAEPAPAAEPGAFVAPSIVVFVVPVPVFAAPAGPRHHHVASAAGPPSNIPNANPVGRFINEPANRFLNPTSPPR